MKQTLLWYLKIFGSGPCIRIPQSNDDMVIKIQNAISDGFKNYTIHFNFKLQLVTLISFVFQIT